MHFEGQFRVPGAPLEVLARFADVDRMARCMPGASIEGRDDDGRYLGTMLVSFGPKQIRFKGKIDAKTDPQALAGELHVRGAADMKATARAEVRVSYTLHSDPAATVPTTIVTLSSDAEIGGVLAEFARTGGVVVTRALMEQFALRAAEEFARDAPGAVTNDHVAPPALPTHSSPPAALSVLALLWQMIKSSVAKMAARVWSRR